MKIYVKQLYDDKGNKIPIVLPEKGSQVSAGYDIVATSGPKFAGEGGPVVDNSYDGGWNRIDYIEYETNLFIAPSAVSFHTLIHPRSSISKYNLVLANSIGLIDNDYRGMIMCRFKYIWQPEDYRFGSAPEGASGPDIVGNPNLEKIYKKGDKIAQLVGETTVGLEWEFVDDLTQTQRGTGGFGSTTPDKTGKPLTEVFAEEAKKFESRKPAPVSPILDKYTEVGGVHTPLPYSERMKERMKS